MLPPLPPPPPGPMIPLVMPLPEAFPVPRAASDTLRRMVRAIPGAVVVVEDEMPRLLPGVQGNMNFLRGRLRVMMKNFRLGDSAQPWWTDPSTIRSGGNVVHRNYPIGGVNF